MKGLFSYSCTYSILAEISIRERISVFLQDPRVKERPPAPSPVHSSTAPQAPVQGELSHNLCWSHHSHVFFKTTVLYCCKTSFFRVSVC